MSTNLQRMLVLVRDGRIDFRSFMEGTRTEFRKLAFTLLRRWRAPEWHTFEDVEQNLYLGAWVHIPKFDPRLAKGNTIARYVVFHAMSFAKTELHKARGVTISGSPDRKVSQIETPLSFFGDDGEGEVLLDSILAEMPRAEDQLIAEEDRKKAVIDAYKACETVSERYAVMAICEAGSLDSAGALLYDHFDQRIILRLASEEHADRFVHRHARTVAERIGARVTPG